MHSHSTKIQFDSCPETCLDLNSEKKAIAFLGEGLEAGLASRSLTSLRSLISSLELDKEVSELNRGDRDNKLGESQVVFLLSTGL